MDSYFVAVTPGLEEVCAQEMRAISLQPQPESGGVIFKGELLDMYRANLHLRTASRILARVGQFFYALTFSELREKASRLPWERFLRPGQPVTLRVTCHKSRLIHTGAVAERIASAVSDRLGAQTPLNIAAEEIEGHALQLIVVRIDQDRVTVSVDTSGELLHRRGYRQAVAKAPLRETLAAGILLASGWDLSSPLVDPFCGSGTIPIEAAMMARAMPPGQHRRFAFMDWPGYDPQSWHALTEKISPRSSAPVTILASDRDAGAVKMARENAARAGVADDIQFECMAVSSITLPSAPGWVVTNPPYGLRVSEGRDLRNLYAQFGNVLRALAPAWHVAVLSSDPVLIGHIGLKMDVSFSTINGGVNVRLGRGMVQREKK